jgi:hypothetical protein
MFTVPRISVVVPAYNVAPYIEETLNALLSQTSPLHQIIVVDDGSTDHTWTILQSYAQHPLVTVLQTENHGCGSARNTGMAKTTGDWIYYCDGDDVVSRDFVEKLSLVMRQWPHLDLLMFAAHTVYEGPKGDFQPDYTRPMTGYFATGVEACAALIDADALEPQPCLYLSRRRLWGPGRLSFPTSLHEDEGVILPLCVAARETMIIPDRLYTRRVRARSIMTSALSPAHAEGVWQAFLATVDTIRTHPPLQTRYAAQSRRRLFILLELYLNRCHRLHLSPRFAEIVWSYGRLWWKPPLYTLWEERGPRKF